MVLPSEKYSDYPRILYGAADDGEGKLDGDLFSEFFKYYSLIICGVTFFLLVAFVAFKNITYAQVYKFERLSIYASELIFAYKVTKQDILKEEQKRA